jgi:hypothetical protein
MLYWPNILTTIIRELGIPTDQAVPWNDLLDWYCLGGRNKPLIPQINMGYGQVMLRHCTCEPSRSHIPLLPGTRWRCGSKVGKPDPSSLPVWALTRGQWLTFFAIWESSLAAWQVDPAWNSGCCLMIFDWISQNFLVHIAQVAGTLWALWYRNCEAGRTCGFQAATFSASVRYVAVELWLVRI